MGRDIRHRLVTVALGAVGAVAAFVPVVILTLNLHISLGVEDGYMASPAQVFERSPLLLGVDVLLAIGVPLLAVALIVWLRHGRDDPR
ncbi:MAG: hypothetical protein WD638_11460 [Nitriliruptoraceae bacterium]